MEVAGFMTYKVYLSPPGGCLGVKYEVTISHVYSFYYIILLFLHLM